jgi:phage tail-like protein
MKRTDIETLLPNIFQRTLREKSPLQAVLDVMETLHAPDEALLNKIDTFFNPRLTRDDFVAYLARWVDLGWLLKDSSHAEQGSISTGLGRLRELVAAAAYMSQWRGTMKGLHRFLAIATGSSDFEIQEKVPGEDGRFRPFHVRVWAPAATRSHRRLIERIIEREKPVYVTYELVFREKIPHNRQVK